MKALVTMKQKLEGKLSSVKERVSLTAKGQLSLNSGIVVSFFVILLAVVALILTSLQADASITADSTAYNAIGDGLTMIGNITSQLGLFGTMLGLGIVVLAAVGIFALASRFTGNRGDSGGGFSV